MVVETGARAGKTQTGTELERHDILSGWVLLTRTTRGTELASLAFNTTVGHVGDKGITHARLHTCPDLDCAVANIVAVDPARIPAFREAVVMYRAGQYPSGCFDLDPSDQKAAQLQGDAFSVTRFPVEGNDVRQVLAKAARTYIAYLRRVLGK
jgi:hypothetical protein